MLLARVARGIGAAFGSGYLFASVGGAFGSLSQSNFYDTPSFDFPFITAVEPQFPQFGDGSSSMTIYGHNFGSDALSTSPSVMVRIFVFPLSVSIVATG